MKKHVDRQDGWGHIRFMDKQTFIATAVSIYGLSGWQTQLAADLGVSEVTVHRYKTGKRNIPQSIGLALEGIKARKEAGK